MQEASTYDWTDSVTWLLVVAGWAILNFQHRSIETRKERREALDQIVSDLRSLEERAIAFHTAETYDHHLIRGIRRDVDRIWPRVSLLRLLESKEAVLITDIRRAITLSNADPTDFVQRDPGDQFVDAISDSLDTLISELDANYVSKYHADIKSNLKRFFRCV